LRRIVALRENSPSRTWPLVGMLALGLVAGTALGGYAASQRSQMKRLSLYVQRMRDEVSAKGTAEGVEPVVVATSTRSNHRRKATSEV
jgi:hypothetical protein